jgi:diguanylate cyclase (GGDEF)-like protein/PAS domain S-box-containing protein
MGLGIWIMHLVAMLSYHPSSTVSFNNGSQLLSLLIAVFFSFLFLRLISVTPFNRIRLITSGIIMGSGIGTMHLIGMKTMNLPFIFQSYWPSLVFSFLIAFLASSAALLLARLSMTKGHKWLVYSSLMMGAATSGMHYTAMQAVSMRPFVDPILHNHENLMGPSNLFATINSATLIVCIVLLIVSILDRKRLNESEQRYKSLFEHNPDIICSLDMKGRILSANQAAERLTGYRQDELIGAEFGVFVPDEEAQHYFQLLKQGQYQEHQLHIIHKNGHLLDIYTTVAPMITDNGIRGFFLIVKDISEQEKAKIELQKSEIKFRSVIETATDAIMITDNDSKFISWNKGAEKAFGYSETEIIGKNIEILIPQRFRELHRSDIENFQKTGEVIRQTIDIFGLKKDGEEFPLELSLNSWTAGEEVYFSYNLRDITLRKQAERTLFEAESKYRSLVEKSLVGVYIVQNEEFVYTNPRFNSLLGYESLVGVNVSEIIFPADRAMVEENLRKRLEGTVPNVEYQCRVKTRLGNVLEIELFGTKIDFNGKSAIIGNVLDITARKASEQLNQFLANHDPLTELPNRRMFKNNLAHAIDVAKISGQRIAVMYLDLDRFKYINDTLGHSMGDRLLTLVANRVRAYLKENDVLARMGGDEFTIFISEVGSSDNAIQVAHEILNIVRTPLILDKYELHVSASIGISFYPEDGVDVEELMKFADTALYRAKDQGKDGFSLYTSAMNSQTHATFFLVNDLHKALQEEQFELYYQPRVCGKTGKVIAAEALLRWNHPKLGLVSPSDFIPMLEETGLIIPVSEWVLHKVCQQRRTWIDASFPLVDVSINFSALQFMQKDLTKLITEQFAAFGLNSQWLEIEITETSLMQNTERITEIFNQVQSMGIKIAIDDFGTGYSSLAYLRKFNIDIVKIDQTFIRNLQDSQENEVITTAIINLAKSLNMRVVAEGVEIEAQREFLREQNCDEMQGYLFSRPLPVSDFESFVLSYK